MTFNNNIVRSAEQLKNHAAFELKVAVYTRRKRHNEFGILKAAHRNYCSSEFPTG